MIHKIHGRLLRIEKNIISVLVNGCIKKFLINNNSIPNNLNVGDFYCLDIQDNAVILCTMIARGKHSSQALSEVNRLNIPTSNNTSRLQILTLRNQIIRAIREYFESENFIEAEVPLLVTGTCPDLYIDSFEVATDGYLTTSTEYQIKRLVAGGFERIFTLTKNFRPNDISWIHNPEFTMLEWSRAYATLDDIEQDAEKLIKIAFGSVYPNRSSFIFNKCNVQIQGTEWKKISVQEAFRQILSINIDDEFSLNSLTAGAIEAGISIPDSFKNNAHDIISLLLAEITPHLGTQVPTFLTDWPSFMTSSAETKNSNVSERSELFIAGVEISDGFPSLLGEKRQRQMFELQMNLRKAQGRPSVQLDTMYLEALEEGIPPSAGMALGIDRLIMVITGAKNIQEVLTFSWDER
ncbi:MAG: amino acid--tRNA ligase-related protein [Candidatus Magasanikbacteria bacterium]